MHLWAVFTVIIIAWLIRHQPISNQVSWSERWYGSLFLLLFPALLILNTAIAVLYMGCHGTMLGINAGSWGCGVAASLILFACGCLVKLIYQSHCSVKNLAAYPQELIEDTTAKVIDFDLPYSAQIGFWQPKLVISHGLLNSLDQDHLKAVIAHEQAHLYYRDTFWFFWWGWMRSFTFWLPQTEALWKELLLLRELRADSKAAQEVDFLLLAESLLVVAKAPVQTSTILSANFNDSHLSDRLNERIDFLLAEKIITSKSYWRNWGWVCLLLIPLLTTSLHC
jgi:Zn-dependent protease with chaperone function